MTQLRTRVDRIEQAAATSTQYGATSDDLANFPGMMNLVAGSGVSFTPGSGTLTISASLTSANLPGGNWIGATNASVTASGATSISTTSFVDVGAGVSLTAGTYLVTSTVRVSLAVSAGTGILIGRLYDATAGSAITDSETLLIRSSLSSITDTTTTISMIVTVGSTSTIRPEARRSTIFATYTTATTGSDSNGYTRTVATRIY